MDGRVVSSGAVRGGIYIYSSKLHLTSSNLLHYNAVFSLLSNLRRRKLNFLSATVCKCAMQYLTYDLSTH
jgi:hypothetical protein